MRHLSALVALALMAAPVQAFDITKMSPEEEAAFGEAVREYLVANPNVLLEMIDLIEKQRAEQQDQADRDAIAALSAEIFEDENSWVGGNPDGDLVLVEFLDYKCGVCKQAHPEVNAALSEDGNIRFIVKEFPILGPESMLAARFAVTVKRLAGDDAYEAVHEEMMTFRGAFTQDGLHGLAARFGLDAEAIMAGMAAPETDAVIAANHALAEKLGINGTPGFIVGDDRVIRGFVPAAALLDLAADARS